MVSFPERPRRCEEWTVPINFLNDASESDRKGYYGENARELADLFSRDPEFLECFVRRNGQEFADEILALAEL